MHFGLNHPQTLIQHVSEMSDDCKTAKNIFKLHWDLAQLIEAL